MTTTITTTVEIDADPDTTGQFVIGQSLLGGSDLIAPDERWIAVDDDRIRRVTIRRGGSEGNRPYDAGEAIVELDNRSGDFDPDNPYGFYVMGPLRLLTQGTGLRIKANAVQAGAPLNANPYFETNVTGWGGVGGATITRSTAQAHEGVASMLITPDGVTADPRAQTDAILVTPGITYTASAWVYSPAGFASTGVGLRLRWYSDTGGTAILATDEDTAAIGAAIWRQHTITTVAPAGALSARVQPMFKGTPSAVVTLHVDEATLAVADATVFTGRVEEPRNTDDLVLPVATYRCVDSLAELGGIDVPAQGGQTGTGESSSSRVAWLLDHAQVPAERRSVEGGGRALLGTTGGGSVRTALDRIAAGEAGRFFVSRDGIVTLTWHDAEYGKASQADFVEDGTGPGYAVLETSPGIVGITNAATVHRIVPQVRNEETGQFEAGPELDDVGAADWESIALYKRREVTAEVFLQDDADVESLAAFLANRRSQPTPRVAKLVTVPLESMAAADAQAVLEADLGDLITVVRTTVDGRLLMWTANIENISIDAVQKETRVTFTTSPSDTAAIFGGDGWFIIGDSLLGGTDVLAPF